MDCSKSLKMTRLFFFTVCPRDLESLILILKKCPEVWSAAFKTCILNSILLFASLLSLLPYCILVPSHKSVASKEEYASNVSPQLSLSILFPCINKHLLLTLMCGGLAILYLKLCAVVWVEGSRCLILEPEQLLSCSWCGFPYVRVFHSCEFLL